MIRLAAWTIALGLLSSAAAWAQPLDPMPRMAIVSAFQPEWVKLKEALEDLAEHTVNGSLFITGRLEGREVVLFLSGISMVNAAMTTQLALERFVVDGMIVSGIAGGVDPELSIGDVVIAERWGQYLEMVFARETDDGYAIPTWMSSDFPNLGMMFVRNVLVASDASSGPESKFWFDADETFLSAARNLVADTELSACTSTGECLDHSPRIVVSGNGVSGSAFVDNAHFREWVFETFEAQVLDMETAAIAHVAYANGVPFIAFRSLSDLAGGGEGENQMRTFMSLAADNSARVVRAFLRNLE